MTKPRLTGEKPIEVTFTSCDVVPKLGEVSVLGILGLEELTRLQTEEADRVVREIGERIETLFPTYGVARTANELRDFQNLSLAVAT